MMTWILSALLTAATWVVEHLIPSWTPPDWLAGGISSVFGDSYYALSNFVANLSAWVPFGLIQYVLLGIVAAVPIAVAIKLARIALSAFTGGGGGAG